MPPSTMMEARPVPNDEPRNNNNIGDHSLRIDETTRKRLEQKQMERKKNDMNSSLRRSKMNESMGKWAGERQEQAKPVKKRKSTNELSGLSHTHHQGNGNPASERTKYSLSKSDHSSRSRKKSDGRLSAMLDYDASQPRKKSDARSVATMPAGALEDNRSLRGGRRKSDPQSPRGRSPGPIKKHYPTRSQSTPSRSQSAGPAAIKKHYPRSQSPAVIQKHQPRSQSTAPESPYRPIQKKYVPPAKRNQSPAPSRLEESPYRPIQKKYVSPAKRRSDTGVTPVKKRSSSVGPMKERSSSPGPMKKRTSSPTPVKKRSVSAGPIQRNANAHSRRDDDNRGKLGMMLDGHEADRTKRHGAKSVASAPARARPRTTPKKSKSTPAQTKSPSTVPKKSRPASSRGESDSTNSRRVRRSKSADEVDLGVLEEHLDMSEEARAEKNERARESQKTKRRSKRNEVGSIQGDNGSVGDDRRQRLSKRTNSMQPRVNVPSKQQPEDQVVDRRAGMKKNKSMPSTPDHYKGDRSAAPDRGHSLLMHRDATRRVGKSNSLADLVQYSEEEIHSTSYFASNHVLVNRERMKRGLRPLTRNIAMDELARENAKSMAESAGVAPIRATYVGNVLRGESIRAIHRSTMQHKDGRERANLLNPYFQDFGVGTAKGGDGMLYMCQLFSERLELTCADVASPSQA